MWVPLGGAKVWTTSGGDNDTELLCSSATRRLPLTLNSGTYSKQLSCLLMFIAVQNEGRVSLTVQLRWRHIVAYGATLECDALRNVLL